MNALLNQNKSILIAGGIVVSRQIFVEHIPMAQEVSLSHRFEIGIESKVINAGRILANEHQVSILGMVGTDRDGKYALEELARFDINTDLVKTTDKEHTGQASVIMDQDGNPAITVHLGANNFNKYPSSLPRFEAFFLATSLPLTTLYQILKNKPQNSLAILDVPNRHQDLDWSKLQNLDFFVPNRYEAQKLLNIKIENINQALRAATELQKKMKGSVIITLDSEGCVIKSPKMLKHMKTQVVHTKDSTGAGDIFRGVFFNEHLKSNNISRSLKKALRIATLSTEIQGVSKSIEFAIEQAQTLD